MWAWDWVSGSGIVCVGLGLGVWEWVCGSGTDSLGLGG